MESAEFSHSRIQRLGAILGAVFVAVLFVPLTVACGWMLISDLLTGDRSLDEERWVIVGGFGAMVWMVMSLVQHLRYWYAYRTRYVLDSQGVQIDGPDERIQLRWDEIAIAEYQPLFFIARLRSPKLDRPAILLLSTENPNARERTDRAQILLQTQLGFRYKKRWLP